LLTKKPTTWTATEISPAISNRLPTTHVSATNQFFLRVWLRVTGCDGSDIDSPNPLGNPKLSITARFAASFGIVAKFRLPVNERNFSYSAQ
jgi:hypothetical protein